MKAIQSITIVQTNDIWMKTEIVDESVVFPALVSIAIGKKNPIKYILPRGKHPGRILMYRHCPTRN